MAEIRIEHIAMYVNDLEGAKEFFEQYFGAKSNEKYHNTKTDFKSYFLSFDKGARLEIMTKPNLSDGEKSLLKTGYAHLALSVGSRERVDRLTSRLKADGYCVINGPGVTGDGYYESCISGFENNQIEITE